MCRQYNASSLNCKQYHMRSAQLCSSLLQAALMSDHLVFNKRLAYTCVSSPKGLLDLAWDPSWPATQQTCVSCDKAMTFVTPCPMSYTKQQYLAIMRTLGSGATGISQSSFSPPMYSFLMPMFLQPSRHVSLRRPTSVPHEISRQQENYVTKLPSVALILPQSTNSI